MFKKRKTGGTPRAKKHDLYVREEKTRAGSAEQPESVAVPAAMASGSPLGPEFPTIALVLEKLRDRLEEVRLAAAGAGAGAGTGAAAAGTGAAAAAAADAADD